MELAKEAATTLQEAQALAALGTMPQWIADAVDSALVSAALRRVVPEFADGTLRLLDCQMLRLRQKDTSGRWNGIYEATIQEHGAEPTNQLLSATLFAPHIAHVADQPSASGAFGGDDWRCWLPDLRLEFGTQPPDTVLAALPQLTDPEQSRELLTESISAHEGYTDFRIASCEPRVMRYKPGSRCTILYRLGYDESIAGRGWPEIVVAKTYHGDKGLNAYEGMQVLWHSPLAAGDVVTIAEPLAYLPDQKVLVQGPIAEEYTLEDAMKRAVDDGSPSALAALDDAMRQAAAGLAALHTSGAYHGEIVTWRDEYKSVRKLVSRIAGAVPEFAAAVTPFVEQLADRAAAVPAGDPLPAHRSFRPAQVLIHQGKIGFIDFDGFCQAEPAMDLAMFRTTLLDVGTRPLKGAGEAAQHARLAQLEAINETFLSAYEALVPVSRERIVLWETLFNLTNVLGCWTKARPSELDQTMRILKQHLRVSHV